MGVAVAARRRDAVAGGGIEDAGGSEGWPQLGRLRERAVRPERVEVRAPLRRHGAPVSQIVGVQPLSEQQAQRTWRAFGGWCGHFSKSPAVFSPQRPAWSSETAV